MVEKLDDSRVRFKRPRDAREQDAYLPDGVDPYRKRYGAPALLYGILVVGVLLGILFVLVFAVLLMV